MSRICFNPQRVKPRAASRTPARGWSLLALILVVALDAGTRPFARGYRAGQIALATAEFSNIAQHSVKAQRDVISSVETVLKSTAHIRLRPAASGAAARFCAAASSRPAPDHKLSIVAADGRVQCSTTPPVCRLRSQRPRLLPKKAVATHDFVVSDYLLAKWPPAADRDGGLPGNRHGLRRIPSLSPASISTGCRRS